MIVNFLLPLGLLIISLFWWPNASVPFEVPKVTLFQFFVKILTFAFIFFFLREGKRWKVNGTILAMVALFTFWATFSSFYGVDIVKSFVGNYYRKDGLLTLYHLVGFSLLVSYFWNDKFKRSISLALFWSSLILSTIAFFEIITGKFGLGTAATFGNPNFLAGYLVVALPFSFYLFKTISEKTYLVGLLFTSLVLILISAYSAILTLILFAVFCVFFGKVKFKFVVVATLFLVSVLIGVIWLMNYSTENSKSFIAEGRVRIYRNVFLGSLKRPIFGYGFANVDHAFKSVVWPLKFESDVYVDKAHSGILEILTTTGIPGLLAYLILIYSLFKKILSKSVVAKDKIWSFTLFSILTLFLFHSQTNVISIAEEIIFWLIVGIAYTF